MRGGDSWRLHVGDDSFSDSVREEIDVGRVRGYIVSGVEGLGSGF